ncbi:MAG: hypothetical protein EHM58_02390 [Ignavibacteriae bacterium]|nr:MAG: hypothetical protein EHM58_02390 [Ignavibacteriota bacterium]
MDKNAELSKIQSLLKIPISEIIFINDYKSVQLFSDGINIRAIPYIKVSGIITYENNKGAVNWLKWVDVYNHNKKFIDPSLTVERI